MRKIRVGIIGCGTIGIEIAKACVDRLKDKMRLIGICDIDYKKTTALNKILGRRYAVLKLDSLIDKADLVVEAASSKISAEVVKRCIGKKKDVLIMSVGGLIDKINLLTSSASRGSRIYIPSGAICGIDGLKAASIGRIDSVTLITRKNPKGLQGATYLLKNKIRIDNVTEETTVFEGTAEEAAEGFPKNINVSAVLALAGLGAKKTRVKIVTSPSYTKNIHEVEIKGDSGRITTRTENVPSKANPKTSNLAILSAIATLEGIAGNLRIGT